MKTPRGRASRFDCPRFGSLTTQLLLNRDCACGILDERKTVPGRASLTYARRMQGSPEPVVAATEEAFWDEERRRTFVPVRVACALGIFAFGSYYFLDPFVAPNVRSLFIARTVIILVHLGVLAFSFTALAARHFRVLALLPCFAIGLGVVVVTQLAGGGASRYHEALLLTFLAYPLVVPTRPISAGLSFASIAFVYGAVMTATGVTGPLSIWMTNNFMLWLAVLIATAGVALGFRERRLAFSAGVTIAKTSEQLAGALAHAQLEKEQSDSLLRQVTTMRTERLTWLENLARFLRHELKNQIVAVGTSIDLAQDGESLDANRIYLGRAQRSLSRMRGLVSSATEATSLEAALVADEMTRVDLSALVAERVYTFQQLHPSRQLVLRLKPELWVEGNEERLAQLLDKLLNNAVEHSPLDAETRVTLRRQGDDWFEISVENEGDALPDDRERMFEAFVSSQSGPENLGLGLFVAQSIARNHGGLISAEDLPNTEGARFVFRLPSVRARAKEQATHSAVGEPSGLRDLPGSTETDSRS